MAYLFRSFPWLFHAPLFRRSSFQFYAYAIGLIAVPLQRFTIPLHCPAIQCRCHPMQFSSIAVRRPTILCPFLSQLRLSKQCHCFAPLFNSIAFQISANPPPLLSSPYLSPAVLVPSQLSSASAFHRYSSPLRNYSAPCCSPAYPFRAFPSHLIAFPWLFVAPLCLCLSLRFNSSAGLCSSMPPLCLNILPCECALTAVPPLADAVE